MTGVGANPPTPGRSGLSPHIRPQNARIPAGWSSGPEKTGQVLVRTPAREKGRDFNGEIELCQEF
jgi:hypothetical protein